MGQNDLRAKNLLAATAVNRVAPGLTDAELGKIFGISKGRAYQLRLSAIAKIRKAFLEDPELRELAEEVCGRPIE